MKRSRINGTFERAIGDMVILSEYPNQYRKDTKVGFKWLNENATILDFENLDDLLTRLVESTEITSEISVLLFDNQKGWGFIRGSDNKDYFVHYSNIETDRKRNLSEEDIVSFEVGIGTNGKKQALHVQPILTYKMVKRALKDEGYHIKPIKDQCNINKYIVWLILFLLCRS